MPDEDGRETYGNAPGWSNQTQKGVEPPADELDAAGDSSNPDAQADSSSEQDSQQQSSEQGTPQKTQAESEKEYNVPPRERWEELVRQKNEAQELARMALERMQVPQAPVAPPEDHWKGLVDHPDPATAQFYQQQRSVLQKEAERIADSKLQAILPAIDAGRRELAEIKISQFRKDNPEIKPGSQEEAVIAGYVSQGYDLVSAKKLAMFDKLEAENRALKGKSQQRQASVPQKVAANNTAYSAGMPESAGLPNKRQSAADRAGEVWDKTGGDINAVLGAMFNNRKRR